MAMQHDTTPRTVLSRRTFLYLTGLAATGLVAAACGGEAPPAATPAAVQPTATPQPTAAPRPTLAIGGGQPTPAAQPTAVPKAYKEAPQLADLVKGGKLPPVEQRLPRNPVVLQPVEQVGKYGGTWRMGLLGGADTALLERTLGGENLVVWDPEWTRVIPNIAASWVASPDAKEYTFTLREGIKWSDGQPFGADDILFWYEDVSMNKELTPSRGANPPTVEKVDANTVKFTFAQPDGFFLQNLARPGGGIYTRFPAHYLKQFHKKYNTTNLDQLIQENQADGWVRLFQAKGGAIPGTPYDARWSNKDLPTLHAWYLTTPYGAGTRVVAERNPYYFKVDTEGNQLPYLDRVAYDVAQDVQVLVLKALNGEIEMQDRHIATAQNKATFVDNAQRGGYRFYETVPDSSNEAAVYLNWTHKDPVMRQLIQSKDFRIGLSHAINRQEIIDVVHIGQGQPYQVASRPESKFYSERFAKQYTEFDVEKANAHLDRVLPQKDGEGFRLRPDGKRLTIVVEVASSNTEQIDVMQLVENYWKRVGVETQTKVEDRSLLWTRKNASEHDAMVWTGDAGLYEELNPSRYFPQFDGSHYAVTWAYWYQKPANPPAAAEEPPEPVKRQMALYDQVKATADEAKRNELMRELLQIAADQFYLIGTVLPANGYGIVKNNFRNVPGRIFSSGSSYNNPAPTNPSQYFIQ